MNELFYFAFADLMVRVEYTQRVSSLSYTSHREMPAEERALVEQYLLAKVAVKTDYFNRPQSRFNYLGVEARLARHVVQYGRRTNREKEEEISSTVEGLINQSMQNFYFEQIGDALLTLRRELRSGKREARVAPLRGKIGELVKAYNHYSERNLDLDEVIPPELKAHMGLPTSPRAKAQELAETVMS